MIEDIIDKLETRYNFLDNYIEYEYLNWYYVNKDQDFLLYLENVLNINEVKSNHKNTDFLISNQFHYDEKPQVYILRSFYDYILKSYNNKEEVDFGR